MKKKLAIVALLGASLASATVLAQGLDLDPKFYVGAEGQVNGYSLKKNYDLRLPNGKKLFGKKQSATGDAGLFVGTRLNDYLGVEAGASFGSAQNAKWNFVNASGRNVIGSAKIQHIHAYADALSYIPLDCDIDLIGSVGVGVLNTKATLNDNVRNIKVSENSTAVGVRAGAGVQYKFDDNLGARLMVRYQQGNKIVKDNVQAGLGLFYQF